MSCIPILPKLLLPPVDEYFPVYIPCHCLSTAGRDDWRLTGVIDLHYKWMAINCKCKYFIYNFICPSPDPTSIK